MPLRDRSKAGLRQLRSWTLQKPQIDRREHQDDSDVYYQPLPELVLEEQDVHADHDGYQHEHVKRDGCLSSHLPFLLPATEWSKSGAGLGGAVVWSAHWHRCCDDNQDQGAEVPGVEHDGEPRWEPRGRTTLRFSGRARAQDPAYRQTHPRQVFDLGNLSRSRVLPASDPERLLLLAESIGGAGRSRGD
jgi:hypothetical protein